MRSKRTKPIASKAAKKARSSSRNRKPGLTKGATPRSGNTVLLSILRMLKERDDVQRAMLERLRQDLNLALTEIRANQLRLSRLESASPKPLPQDPYRQNPNIVNFVAGLQRSQKD